MPQMTRYWAKSRNYPLYAVSDTGEIRKIGSEFDQIIPQFWGRLDHNSEPEWLVTIFDEERGREVTIPEGNVTAFLSYFEAKYENY